jgi:hypothetical protein
MLIAITGPIGGGKTCFQTRCLYREKMKRPNARIVTNYKLNNIKHEYIDAKELFEMKEQLKNTILGIDEMHIFMDCRDSLKFTNKMMTHFILQTRHLGVHMYFTTQDISQVDIRLRRMLDLLAYCTKSVYQDWFKIKLIDYRDVLNIQTNEFMFNGRPYYDLYDTTEIIDINVNS